MNNNYVLDTSAFFTFIEDEEGAEKIDNLLKLAEDDKIIIYISFISICEIYYITLQEKDEDIAKKRIDLIKSLKIQIIQSNDEICFSAANLKAIYKISLADSFIAALSEFMNAELVHKDPEYEKLKEKIKLIQLPYKK